MLEYQGILLYGRHNLGTGPPRRDKVVSLAAFDAVHDLLISLMVLWLQGASSSAYQQWIEISSVVCQLFVQTPISLLAKITEYLCLQLYACKCKSEPSDPNHGITTSCQRGLRLSTMHVIALTDSLYPKKSD